MTSVPPAFHRQVPQTAGKAIAALVFAILAWLACPFIFAIVAVVLAGQAETEIRASGGYLTGESLVTAARLVAWIHLALFALVLLGIAFLRPARF